MNEDCVCAFLEGNLVSFRGAIAMIKNMVDAEKRVECDICGWCVLRATRMFFSGAERVGTTMDLCWWDTETLSLCGLMWKRFQCVSQSLVHEIKRTRWRIKQISLSLSLWLLCSSCEAVGGSHLCLFCLCLPAVMVGDGFFIELERGVSAACYASERGVTQLCVEFTPAVSFSVCFSFASSRRVRARSDVDVSQTPLLLFALFLQKYDGTVSSGRQVEMTRREF